jgi:hypothetical protein
MPPPLMFRGNSPTAQYLDNASQANGQYFRQSAVFSKQPAFDQLITIWEECKTPNWDGDDAFPVGEQTFSYAYHFITALPLGCSLPSVGAEPDGHLTLEWYRHPRWILSISISPEGILYYAALFGSSDVRGSEVFSGEISRTLLDLMQPVEIK